MPRNEIEDEVWAGTVVGYDAITQSVSKLRKALSDDPRRPHIVETVAKTGYRLIAPVEQASVESEAAPSEDAGIWAPVVRSGAAEADRSRSRFIHRIGPVTAILLLLLAGLTWFSTRLIAPEETEPQRPTLAVLPFDNLSSELNLDYLSEVVTQDVTTALAGHAGIEVVSSRVVLDERDEGVEPTIIARRMGARYLVEGSVRGEADDLHINARLTDTGSNRHLWAKRYDQKLDNVLAVVDDITLHVVDTLLPGDVPVAVEGVSATEPPAEFDYEAMVDSPRRLKCLYGNFAQISGDHAMAARIFEDCIERWNDVRSMISLAHILELGVGVPQDLPRAALLLQRGAYTDDPEGYGSLARFHYGMALLQGSGIAPDGVEGLRWLRRVASEGVEDAWEYLARHFPEQLPNAGSTDPGNQ